MSEMNLTKVRLRAMEPEDLDFLYNIENDRELWNVGNTNVPYSRYVLHDYIANATNDIYSDGQVRMIVENAEGCRLQCQPQTRRTEHRHYARLSPLWVC